ncbi:MAG: efflux RND transporter periplasmic adaptor subunit [Opitutaceae bacterium]|jgi:Cu(I)/Ag(I) efflux system membrane fusion protein|nr:efflux RND transporter periplasmic adaptor subunit [Opitutaceae bacterium]
MSAYFHRMSAPFKTATLILLTALVAGGAGYFIARKTAPRASTAGTETAGTETGGPETGGRKIKFYQSPMHPWIKSARPGKCTICGMDLVPVYEGDAGFDTGDSGLITLQPATAAVIGVETSPVTRGTLTRTLRVTGVLDDDETLHRVLSARVPGRIEKLFINTIGATVEAGAPLATLYSPDMLTAQRQYLERVRAGDVFAEADRSEARERLMLLGIEPADIAALEKSQQPSATYTLRAPAAGTVITRNVYEGQYVQTNAHLFEIGDFTHLWFVFDAYETDLPWLRVGQTVDVSTPSLQGETITAPIAFIDPNLNEMTRTARVRVVIDNTARRFLHRQTAYGRVHISLADKLLVPRSALVFTQTQPVVYVDKTNNAYEPRAITPGPAGDADYAVISGLREGERVVTQGALLIDGQAQLARAAQGSGGAGGLPVFEDGQSQSHGQDAHATQSHGQDVRATQPHGQDVRATQNHGPAAAHAAQSADIAALTPLVLATADAATALAADNLVAYQKQIPAIQTALAGYIEKTPSAKSGPLAQFAAGLKPGPTLRDARASYEIFSTAVADLAKAAHLHHSGVVRIYQCPMTPVLGTGRWVQRAAPAAAAALANPFFGSAMPECGEEIK